MKKLLLVFSLLFVLSCQKSQRTASDGVYFAGEIVNPTDDYVVLYRNQEVVDSAKLDVRNRFVFKLDSIQGGLHHFTNHPEWQYIYLEKGDSLLVRLNTVAFDESMVFSGTNGDVNNFLIEMFLHHEDEEVFVKNLYLLHPEEFSHKLDSLRQLKLNELRDLTSSANLSQEAYTLALASINYYNFMYKEKYPYLHRKWTGEETLHVLDSTFYRHRAWVPTNYKELVYYKPFFDYMKLHLSNLAYTACADNCSSTTKSRGHYLHLNQHKMHLVDSLILDEELRNNLFRSIVVDVLLKEHNPNTECSSFIKKFERLTTNDKHRHYIKQLYEGIKNLQPSKAVPHLDLVSANGTTTNLKQVAKSKHTVFYFWSSGQKKHFRNTLKHIDKLKKKYPQTQFVGLCIMTSKSQWSTILLEGGIDASKQYWIENMDDVKNKLIVHSPNKCLIINNTLVEDGFANLYTSL